MMRIKNFNLVTLTLTFLASVPNMESEIMPQAIPLSPPPLHPLCSTQLALVSYVCAMLPFSPGSPPLPLMAPPDDDEGHRSHHRHGHSHWQSHRRNPQEDNCCRWASEMDSQCVCDFRVRLPPFLTRPLHRCSIMIGESCNVTYSCGGPI